MSGTNSVRVGQKGRIVLPAEARRALGAEEDTELILIVREHEVVLMSKAQARDKLRAMFAGGPNPVDELLAERHAEAELEAEDEQEGLRGQGRS